ncbi:MAG: hypothetical protein RMJ14_06350 [Nitrososphaerota archaeon]|nr:hypothetical protein [Nitrososphaerota archaeon]
MRKRSYLDYLQDIDDVESFTAGMSFEDFANDKKPLVRCGFAGDCLDRFKYDVLSSL